MSSRNHVATDNTVTVRPTTSAESRHRYPWDHHELVDPAAAGLPRATGVRRAESTVDVIDVVAVIGRLGDADEKAVLGPAHGHALPAAA